MKRPIKKVTAARKNPKPKHKKTAPGRRFWLRVGAWLFAATCVALLVCLAVLDRQVRQKFDGRKWELPARVYAQPLELYVGQQLTQTDLRDELKALDYKLGLRVAQPGHWREQGDEFEFYARGFAIADDVEPARALRVRLVRSQVVSLTTASGQALTFARLEPPQIGGIYPRQQEDRELVQLSEVPAILGETLIAVEDRSFVNHWGVSPRAIARAAWVNTQSGRVVQGGSTLTQQLVKNFYLDQSRRLSRKLLEAAMALILEAHYSKAEILETYLNEVYLGQSGPRSIHGFGLAARHYFRRPLQQLDTHEIALLVGLVKGASYYNPWRNPERALQRRNLVIDIMRQQGLIDAAEAARHQRKALGVVDPSQRQLHAYPAFIDLVKRQLLADYTAETLSSDGLSIYSTLSLRAQRHAETALAERLTALEAAYGTSDLQGAVALAAIGSGEVEALVGDRNSQFSGFNRALNARRPIGSLVKPAVYLTALQQGYHLASRVSDGPVVVAGPDGERWKPRNFDRQSHGDVLLIDALVHSYNQATARLGMMVGLPAVAVTLQRLGVEESITPVPSLLLGSISLTPFEVLKTYHTLANDGVRTPMRAIRQVVGTGGQRLSRYPLKIEQALAADKVHLTQFAMLSVMREGTGRSVYASLPEDLLLAGKTGTTNDQRDSWFAGFSGQHLAVVWLGRDDNGVTPLTGSSGALRVWRDLFLRLPTEGLSIPAVDALDYLWVDSVTGAVSGENCRGARWLPFTQDARPTEVADCEWRQNPIYHWLRKWW